MAELNDLADRLLDCTARGEVRGVHAIGTVYDAAVYLRAHQQLREEADQLRQWKESAMQQLSAWDEVWEVLGRPGPLGGSKAANSKAKVERLLRRDLS